ncbi:hypothetical protein KY306_03015 [Candidatus Woesearchaeota archaeon]|nr:hypothetical protein [Candidatus Woesearchaeota archaeon]
MALLEYRRRICKSQQETLHNLFGAEIENYFHWKNIDDVKPNLPNFFSSEFYKTEFKELRKNELETGRWSENEAVDVKVRNLFGIIGVTAIYTRKGRNFYTGFFLPKANEAALDEALQNSGWFRKLLEETDLRVLGYIRERGNEIRKSNYGVRFAVPELQRVLGLGREETIASIDNLTGILCPSDGPRHYVANFGEGNQQYSNNYWFLPHHQDKLAVAVLNQEEIRKRNFEVRKIG